MASWRAALPADPLDWLLEPGDPAVRHLALRQLFDRPADDPDVAASRRAAMTADPIASILAAQLPDGYWEKSGPGYATKYRDTVWQLIFLDQLGADPGDGRIGHVCEYVLSHSQAENGGFGASGVAGGSPPPSSRVIHSSPATSCGHSSASDGWMIHGSCEPSTGRPARSPARVS